jgi:2-hydroxychromene-2-carboxylate isomerase
MRQKNYVLGMPTLVFNGELFWGGDRIDMLIERIDGPGWAPAVEKGN